MNRHPLLLILILIRLVWSSLRCVFTVPLCGRRIIELHQNLHSYEAIKN